MLLLSWLEVTIAVLIFADPRRTVDSADIAHGVEGYAGDGVEYQVTSTQYYGHRGLRRCPTPWYTVTVQRPRRTRR